MFFLHCSGGYVFHNCTWGSGERDERSIQHQNRNRKLELMYPENYVWICVHANELGQQAVL